MATPRTRPLQAAIRSRFDVEMIDQYTEFIEGQLSRSPSVLWASIAECLRFSETTRYRRFKKAGRSGASVRGKPEPRLADLLRYTAATDRIVRLPGGREVVLKSLAATLSFIRFHTPRGDTPEITPHRVELLRFVLAYPGHLKPGPGISTMMVEKIRVEMGHALADPCVSDQNVMAEVAQILKGWREPWARLIETVPYDWIYYRKNAP